MCVDLKSQQLISDHCVYPELIALYQFTTFQFSSTGLKYDSIPRNGTGTARCTLARRYALSVSTVLYLLYRTAPARSYDTGQTRLGYCLTRQPTRRHIVTMRPDGRYTTQCAMSYRVFPLHHSQSHPSRQLLGSAWLRSAPLGSPTTLYHRLVVEEVERNRLLPRPAL